MLRAAATMTVVFAFLEIMCVHHVRACRTTLRTRRHYNNTTNAEEASAIRAHTTQAPREPGNIADWHAHCLTSCCAHAPQKITMLSEACSMCSDECVIHKCGKSRDGTAVHHIIPWSNMDANTIPYTQIVTTKTVEHYCQHI